MLLTNRVADIAIRAALFIIVLFLSLVTFLPNLILRR